MQGFMIFTGVRDPCEKNTMQKLSPEKKFLNKNLLFSANVTREFLGTSRDLYASSALDLFKARF